MSWLRIYCTLVHSVCAWQQSLAFWPVLMSCICIQTKLNKSVDIYSGLMGQVADFNNCDGNTWICMFLAFAYSAILSLHTSFMFLGLMSGVSRCNWQAHLASLLQGPYNQQQHHSLLWNGAIWRVSWQRVDECFQYIKCKSKGVFYTVWIIVNRPSLFYYCSPVNYFPLQVTDWNYRCTWAESNKWSFQVMLITSGEGLTQNTDMSIKIPNLSKGNYLHSP